MNEKIGSYGDHKAVMDVLSQMLCITNYLHSNNIFHRNLNPDCFLLNPKLSKLYIFDLGSCIAIEEMKDKPSTNTLFTSPEMLNNS